MKIWQSIIGAFFGYAAIPVGLVMIFHLFFWVPEWAGINYLVGSWAGGGFLIGISSYLHISIYFDDRIIRENEEYYQKMQSGMENYPKVKSRVIK